MTTEPLTAPPIDPVGRRIPYVPLRGSAPLALRAHACLAVRAPESACRSCADACPVAVLIRKDGAPVLGDGCLGCGRCAAVCPTDALRVPGFAVNPPDYATEVTVDCWRVARADSRADALRVPCLNGLTLGRLLVIAAEAAGRPVLLVDRGFCVSCPAAAGDAKPAIGVLAAAGALLGALGVPRSRYPRLIEQPLPAGRMQADPAGFVLEERVSRRGFLTALTARAAAAEPRLDAGPAAAPQAAPLRRRAPSEERQRLLAALRRLAPGVSLPVHLFPSLKVASTCADHRICAAACPTGALSDYARANDGAEDRGIDFDPQACVACGLCVACCPTRSLSLVDGEATEAAGSAEPSDPSAPRTLTRHRQRACDRCGAAYAGEAPSCPACQRDRAFARSAFSQLFGGADRP